MIYNILIYSFFININNYNSKNNICKSINSFKINRHVNITPILSNNDKLNKIISINSNFNNNYYNKIINELNFLLNKKTKVYLHLEQLFYKTNIYHVGISFHNIFNNVRYDIGLFDISNLNILTKNRKEKTIFWDYSNKTLYSIIEYEKTLSYKYILGVYDCRHYVRNLSQWSTNNPTPIWRLYELY